MFVSLQPQKTTIITQLIKIRMEQKELTNTYQSPKITVVTFRLRTALAASQKQAEATGSSISAATPSTD